MIAYGPSLSIAGEASSCFRTPARPPCSPWRTVTTKSGPTKIMISPVSTISRALTIDNVLDVFHVLSTRNNVLS